MSPVALHYVYLIAVSNLNV